MAKTQVELQREYRKRKAEEMSKTSERMNKLEARLANIACLLAQGEQSATARARQIAEGSIEEPEFLMEPDGSMDDAETKGEQFVKQSAVSAGMDVW